MADVSGKKRKHNDSHGPEKKKKKVAADSTTSSSARTITVTSVTQANASPPVVATAPGISVTKDAVFNSYSRKPTSGKRSRHRSHDLLLHSTSHRTLDYTAREDKPKDGHGLLNHYIGLFDSATGQLQLVEAKKMVVRGAVRAQQASEEDMRSQQTASQSNYDLKTELGQAFGTKKAKKALAAVIDNAISPTKPQRGDAPQALDASEKALMASIKDVTLSVPTQQDLQNVIDANKPVPRGNYNADEIQDVYRPEDLVGRDILELIPVQDWATAVKKNEDVKLRTRFVANRLRRVGSSGEVLRLRLLRYAYFLEVVLMTARKGKERGTRELLKRDKLQEELSPAPPPVVESIRRRFSDKGILRKLHVDLLVTHLCALACILDNFETNTWDLKEDIKLEQKEMNQYFMEIGARINKKKGEEGRTDSIAVLKLPLVFPKIRVGRRS